MYVSHIDRRVIASQVIVNGKLVTDFRQALWCDGSVQHEALAQGS